MPPRAFYMERTPRVGRLRFASQVTATRFYSVPLEWFPATIHLCASNHQSLTKGTPEAPVASPDCRHPRSTRRNRAR